MSKEFILLKDLPDAKAGTVLKYDCDGCYDYTSNNNEECWYNKIHVENNPDWFKEVKPIPENFLNWKGVVQDIISFNKGGMPLDELVEHLERQVEIINNKLPDKPILEYEILSFRHKTNLDLTMNLNKDDGSYSYHKDTVRMGYENCIVAYDIFSVKRNNDGEVFCVGDKVKTDDILFNKIKRFEILKGDMFVVIGGGTVVSYYPLKSISKEPERIPLDNLPKCFICGGETVLIRGKYPGTDKRNICPQCTTERLEQIQDIASPDYGKTCKNN